MFQYIKEAVKYSFYGFLIMLGFILIFYPPQIWLGPMAVDLLPEWLTQYSLAMNFLRNGWVLAGSLTIGGAIVLCKLAMAKI